MTTLNNAFETTAVRNVVRGAVSSIVGALVAWGTTKWGSLNNSNLAYLVPAFSTAYFAAIHFLEKKYPKLGWLLGVLPKATPVVIVPAVTPAPTPAPTVVKINAPTAAEAVKKAPAAKKAAAVKKAAPKKNTK